MDMFNPSSTKYHGFILFISTGVFSVFGRKIFSNLFKNLKNNRSFLSTRSFSSLSNETDEQTKQQIRKHWFARSREHDYLKEVLGEKALDWVKKENNITLYKIGDPTKSPFYPKVLSILDSEEKIPYVRKIKDQYYNFWKDKHHPRGIWRRTSLASYESLNPEWETVLDLDQLGSVEKESWVYKGYTLYEPNTREKRTPGEHEQRCMFKLSRGGADAVVIREFDLKTLKFVDKNPFILPEAKSSVAWKSLDVLLVGTDLHDGESMTESGYPRVVREWVRGTELNEAKIVYEGEVTDVSVRAYVARHKDYEFEMRYRSLTFYTSLKSICLSANSLKNHGEPIEDEDKKVWCDLPLPKDASLGHFADQMLISLRSDWEFGENSFRQGSLLSVPIVDFVKDFSTAQYTILFTPTPTVSLESYTITKNYIILETLDTVKSKLVFWKFEDSDKSWVFCGAEREASVRGSSVSAVDEDENDFYWFTSGSFLQPTALQIGDAALGPAGVSEVRTCKSLPAQFDSTGLVETQFQAVSIDGTKVPYFLIYHENMPFDGSTPTLLYGYGGFEISLTPSYSGVVGSTWLQQPSAEASLEGSRGYSCYVMANIRGGGEFGPAWHQAALRENRCLAYEDFIAVAEDLIKRKITSPKRLGIRGGSNGGLLMGNMMTMRPDLFGAVCCAVPLLDMQCYHQLLAGASWVAEYGDPEKPEDWAFLQKYSAYHNINPVEVGKGGYPPLLMTTSTRDDRVHPYHARSFAKRIQEAGNVENKVFYYENIEGGHGGAADNKQQAFMNVLYLEFLRKVIGFKEQK